MRERNHYGILTGIVKSEAKEQYPHLVELLKDVHNTLEGGEPYIPFKEMIERALFDITKRNYNTVAIVTHGGPIRVIFREILKLASLK